MVTRTGRGVAKTDARIGGKGLFSKERVAARRAKRKKRRDTRRSEAEERRAVDTARVRQREARDDRKAANGVAVGSTVAADLDGARPDIGGKLAGEGGRKTTGYAGVVTPGQRRGSEQTGIGKFPVYGKKMQAAKSFRATFADARKGGKKTFEWQGRKYTTDLA